MSKHPYPFVECEITHEVRSGYLACEHVLNGFDGSPIAVVAPTEERIGVIECAACHEAHQIENLKITLCAHCAEATILRQSKAQ